MDMDRRTFVRLASLAGMVGGMQALAPSSARSGTLREMRASLGSQVLSSGVAFFWIGTHKKLNYFEQEGLLASWRGVQNQTQALALLNAGQQEVGGVGPSTLLRLAADGKGVPMKVAYAHYQRNPYHGAVLQDSRIKSWADVKGKKVGLISLGQLSTKWYAEAALREAGGDPAKDISFYPVGVHAPAGIALEKRTVDIYVSHISHMTVLKRFGFKIRTLPEPKFAGYNSFDGGMTVPNRLLDEPAGRKALVGFFRAVTKGMVFSVENPRAAQLIHYDLFPGALPKGKTYDVAVEEAIEEYKQILEVTVPPEQNGVFGEQQRTRWETVAYDLMQLTRAQIPNVQKFYDSEIAQQANDFNHAAIKQQAQQFKL